MGRGRTGHRSSRRDQPVTRVRTASLLKLLAITITTDLYMANPKWDCDHSRSSMEDKTGRENFIAASDKENTVSHSNCINGKPKKLQYSSKRAFSICYDKSFLSFLVPPPKGGTCHHCGLFGKALSVSSPIMIQKEKDGMKALPAFFSQLTGIHCSLTGVDILQEEVRLRFAVDVLPDSGKHLLMWLLIGNLFSFLCAVSENHSKGSERGCEDEDSFHSANSVTKFVSLSIGEKFSGVVSHIQDPDSFFCQRMQSARQLAELEASLNEYCGKIPSSPSFRPAAGNVCCAQFTEDNLWYRAAVTAYASEDTVLVNYMDYGNSDSLPLTRLRPIIPSLMDLPAQAIRCSLAGVKPPLGGVWTSEGISYMKKLVKDKVLTVKVVDKDSSKSMVEITDASVIPVINVSSLLLEEGFAAEELSMALPAARGTDAEQANKDGSWYRAVVQNVTSDGSVRVSFVDYGNTEDVPRDNIRQISSSFLKLPFQAIKCWLSGIKPGNSHWNPEATRRFHMCTSGLELQATLNTSCPAGGITDKKRKIKIAVFVLNECCLPLFVFLKGRHVVISEIQKITSLGHWKSIELAVDETMSVCVTEVVSPDLFYAVPVANKGQKNLFKELISLEDYCRSCNKQPFQPKPGEACCAQFSGNGNWYRAVVLEDFQSAVKVLYGDYGSTETLPLSKVLPITDTYLKLPFQTITCSLAGIEKVEWSPLVLDKLKKLLLKQHVTITVKGINGNVNLVTVEKHLDNGYVNVADRLLKEGNEGVTNCCCKELKVQLEKHKQVLLFLLNKFGNPEGFSDMKNLLKH
ncbi:Tudor domain-containing protein 1 [Lonchura striata]|uniref:Tudor domain-containing protein 1 n=1 Tax=Lonchura striata TaxID=40157 RepID=A0A218UTM8_9PASE|nr:Tudor domain-containing protein 1 [Lonchura striata domestica]